jgi:cyclopropane fatty-acyl-phospholipid synthase-like methyltransferase
LVFEITSAVHPAFAFLAGTQLDVFSPLQEGPLTVEQLANILGVSAPKLKPLLYALVASKLLVLENDRFANTEVANHYLVRDSPRYLGSMHELLTFLWEAELQTSASIRTGVPQAKHNYATASTDELEQVFQGLHPGTIAAAYALLKRYDFSPYHTLLDVGGGSGGLTITIVEKHPHIEATVLDLPSVTPITQKFVDSSESGDRIQVVSRDVVQESVEGSYDVAILRAFIQVLGPDEVRQVLKHVSEAIIPGGHIYIAGAVLDNSRLSPPETVAFNLVFLNVYDEGEAYTEQEYRDWLDEADFENVERVLLRDGNSFITAQKRG